MASCKKNINLLKDIQTLYRISLSFELMSMDVSEKEI